MKFTRGFSVAILTFLIGVSAASVATLNEAIPMLDELPIAQVPINACSLFANSDHLLNRRIVVDALLFRSHAGVMVYSRNGLDCSQPDPVHGYFSHDFDPSIYTTLDLPGYVGPNSNVEDLLETTRKGMEIEVRIEGILVSSPTKICPFRYSLIPSRIVLTSPWTPFTAKGAA